jgi:CubicO group peptidase (beta-lactamase class C family)
MARLLMSALALLALSATAAAQETQACGTPISNGDGWALARPESVDMDTGQLCQLDNFLAEWKEANIHAVVVARAGKLVMERYFTGPDERWGTPIGTIAHAPDVKHDLRSISKSVTSLLVGIALGEGKFPALDSPVIDQFPEYASLRNADNARITFRQLLTMSSGLKWDESTPYSDPDNSELRMIMAADPIRYVLEQPVIAQPGSTYNYNGGNTTLLGAVVSKVTGKRLDDYAKEKLFGPLGITDFEWVNLPSSGQPAAASGLRLRPRDTAKLGQLMVADGVWNDTQILPPGWTGSLMKPRLSGEGLYYYGYQWWLGRTMRNDKSLHWAAAVGYGGQRLYAVPDLDLVVVINAGHYGAGPLQSVIPFGILTRVVMPAVKD